MRLIITRHGETVENQQGIIQGHLPGKLTKLGKEQAKKLALRLKKEKIDYIYSSDLARATDTTKEIVKFHPKVPVIFTKELREKYLGEYQGKKRETVDHSREPIDGETWKEMFNRCKRFLSKTITKHSNHTILLIGHGGSTKIVMGIILGKSLKEIRVMKPLDNVEVRMFEV